MSFQKYGDDTGRWIWKAHKSHSGVPPIENTQRISHRSQPTLLGITRILAVKWRLIFGCICNQTPKIIFNLAFFFCVVSFQDIALIVSPRWCCSIPCSFNNTYFLVFEFRIWFWLWFYFIPSPKSFNRFLHPLCDGLFLLCVWTTHRIFEKYLPWVCRESIMIYARRWSICHGFVWRA